MNFKKFDQTARNLVKEYQQGSNYTGSDYSYFGYMIWFDDLEYAQGEDALFFRAFFNGELRYWTPLVRNGMTRARAIEQLPTDCSFVSANEDFAAEMEGKFVNCTNRDWSEYIYRTADFIALVGKRYNAKRNHISKFTKKYQYTMTAYTQQDKQDISDFEDKWLAGRTFDTDKAKASALKERSIMFEALDASLHGETVCDVLRVDGQIAGFALGEIMPSGNAVVIYEKADIAYEGIYSFLAHEFAARNLSSCEYINRQEDMGIEGLRKSKLSYYPEFLLDKYVLTPIERCKKTEDGDIIKPCQGDSSLIDADKSLGHYNVPQQSANISSLEQRIADLNIDNYKFAQLSVKDFNSVMTFLKCGISKLEDRKFFMNYTDEELLGVLDKGYMLGAFYEGHLVATCGLDFDSAFGDKLAQLCHDGRGRQYYEYSGIMVCPFHRRKGLANAVCQKVIDYAKATLQNATLCATVQYNNIASLTNLKKLGFEERAQAEYKEYNFKYLTLDIN